MFGSRLFEMEKYPIDKYSFTQNHLLLLFDCCIYRNPRWCYSYWCFVDRERCARPFTSVNDVNATSQLYLGFGDNFTDMDRKCLDYLIGLYRFLPFRVICVQQTQIVQYFVSG